MDELAFAAYVATFDEAAEGAICDAKGLSQVKGELADTICYPVQGMGVFGIPEVDVVNQDENQIGSDESSQETEQRSVGVDEVLDEE